MPNEFKQFDYNTISDVILHLRYTAREGGALLKSGAVQQINEIVKDATASVLARSFSLKHNFPTERHRFVSSTSNENVKIVTDTSSLISLQTGDILELSLELFDLSIPEIVFLCGLEEVKRES